MTGFRIQRVAVAGVVALGLLQACEAKRSSVLNPYGPPSYDFRIAKAGQDMPGGTVAFTEPFNAAKAATVDTTVAITLTGIDSLTTGVYQVWLGDAASASPKYYPAKGRLYVTRLDTAADGSVAKTVDSSQVTSSFKAGGADETIKLVVTPATYGSKLPTEKLVLVTIEQAPGATSPGDSRPLWALRSSAKVSSYAYDTTSADTTIKTDTTITTSGGTTDTTVTTDTTIKVLATDTLSKTSTASTKFGRYDPAAPYVFSALGRGTAGIRGGTLIVDDSALMRPPVGYYYAGWVVKYNDAGAIDQAVPMGPQTAPYPNRSTSLMDADIKAIPPWVSATPPEVFAAASRIRADTASALVAGGSPFAGWSEVRVTLEAKQGAGTMAPPVILSAALPCTAVGGC